MKKIGIISDTHGFWDDRYASYFSDCDEIWHAGDIGDIQIIHNLEKISTVRAVTGNVDFGEVKRTFSPYLLFRIEGVKVMLVHIGGYPGKWAKGIKEILKNEKVNLMVDGHSHILKVIYDKDLELLHINPGAAGQQGWHRVRTLIRIEIDNTDIKNCEIIELG